MYTSVLHQRGTVDVMKHLSAVAYQKPYLSSRMLHEFKEIKKIDEMSVLFLMPCHSTPWYR